MENQNNVSCSLLLDVSFEDVDDSFKGMGDSSKVMDDSFEGSGDSGKGSKRSRMEAVEWMVPCCDWFFFGACFFEIPFFFTAFLLSGFVLADLKD